MIYVTGDTHGYTDHLSPEFFMGKIGKVPEKDDFVIVAGDFGFLWYADARDTEKLDVLEKCGFTILFVDGNHENYDELKKFPIQEWNGGKVHKIRENIYHLMRGQVFTIDGRRVFVFGGAYSHDRHTRQEGVSYWQEEIPCNEEYIEAGRNLENHGKEVDFIVTHTCPSRIVRRLGFYPDRHDGELTGFFDWVMDESNFKNWFFGHFHEDRIIDDRFRALMWDVVEV